MSDREGGVLELDGASRRALWRQVSEAIEAYIEGVSNLPVSPALDPEGLRNLLRPFKFEQPLTPKEAAAFAVAGLLKHQVHTPHPRYFGLFNPAPTAMGIAADTLVAAFNPQLAAWSHSPLAAEIERHVLRAVASRFGYEPEATDGTLASGGAEANHTALLVALTHRFPAFSEHGLRSLDGEPVLYTSTEGHHSVSKAARLCGLGAGAVREIAVDEQLCLRVDELERVLEQDRRAGRRPFLIVATAGTTSSGAIDPLPELASLAERAGVWLHVDAAWGGASALVPELRSLLQGIERADSITFDAHKWLSVPMGAGMFLTRHPGLLERTFRVANAYMPREAEALGAADPYAHSMQWSRRFIGLKIFLSLCVAGWDGYASVLRHQVAMGELLRQLLRNRGFRIVNATRLPIVCFDDPRLLEMGGEAALWALAALVVESGEAWISPTRVGGGKGVLRACITNYRTQASDVEALVASLTRVRDTNFS